MRAVYRYWAAIVFLAVVVQVGFAGYGAFDVAGTTSDGGTVDEDAVMDSFEPHLILGYLIVLATLLLLVFAFAARIGRPRLVRTAALFGLLILQVLLAWFGYEVPVIGFFHPVNALLIFGLSGSIAWSEWRGEAATLERPAPAP